MIDIDTETRITWRHSRFAGIVIYGVVVWVEMRISRVECSSESEKGEARFVLMEPTC
jgi:hypothetical protein